MAGIDDDQASVGHGSRAAGGDRYIARLYGDAEAGHPQHAQDGFLPAARRVSIATSSGTLTERRKLGSPDLLRRGYLTGFVAVLTLIGLRLVRGVRRHLEFEW